MAVEARPVHTGDPCEFLDRRLVGEVPDQVISNPTHLCDGALSDGVDEIASERPGEDAKENLLLESQEPYVLEYELFRDPDGTYLQHERYENGASIAEPLRVTAEGQADWGEAAELFEGRFVGALSAEVRGGLRPAVRAVVRAGRVGAAIPRRRHLGLTTPTGVSSDLACRVRARREDRACL